MLKGSQKGEGDPYSVLQGNPTKMALEKCLSEPNMDIELEGTSWVYEPVGFIAFTGNPVILSCS